MDERRITSSEILSSPTVTGGTAATSALRVQKSADVPVPRGIVKMAATLLGGAGGSGESVPRGDVRGIASLRGIGAAGPRDGKRGRAAAFGHGRNIASLRGKGAAGPHGGKRGNAAAHGQATEEEDLMQSPGKR